VRIAKADAAKRRKIIQSLVSASIVDENGVEVHPLEKIRMAFALMEERGVVAEGRWLCCNNCGTAFMQELFEEWPKSKPFPFGYCFFHEDDWEDYTTEWAAEDDKQHLLHLSFRSFAGADTAVGKIVTDCLDAMGLEWEWNGSAKKRIAVEMGERSGLGAKWRRSRRCAKASKDS
jgi:hypothetical protein